MWRAGKFGITLINTPFWLKFFLWDWIFVLLDVHIWCFKLFPQQCLLASTVLLSAMYAQAHPNASPFGHESSDTSCLELDFHCYYKIKTLLSVWIHSIFKTVGPVHIRDCVKMKFLISKQLCWKHKTRPPDYWHSFFWEIKLNKTIMKLGKTICRPSRL